MNELTVAAGAVDAAPPARRTRHGSDLFNPVLVREATQVAATRFFRALTAIALAGAALAACGALTGNRPDADLALVGDSFFGALQAVFFPLTTLLTPVAVFFSMRAEAAGSTAESLLVTGFRPGAVVRGKLQVVALQYLFWASLFAPLVASAYLLGGVGLADIARFYVDSAALCAALSGVMMVAGAATRGAPIVGALIAILVVLSSAISLFAAGVAVRFGAPTSPPDPKAMLFRILTAATVTGGCALGAAGALTHPFENRATAMRVFLLVALAGFAAALACTGASGNEWSMFALIAAACATPIFVAGATEEEPLSPRVRTLVPRSRAAALLAVPFLPGRGRGLLFALLVIAALTPIANLASDRRDATRAFGVLGYAAVYAALGCLCRGPLGPGRRFDRAARGMVVLIGLLACFFPWAFEGFSPRSWSALHVFNPFFTVPEMEGDLDVALAPWILLALLLAPSARAMASAFEEVANASAARRRREA
ncbi:MAG TPA: hypothetical protein VEI02_12215 [Planctomycetota bacterium]|nr:hypothetical protein [Planctomycetota bacterium]